MKKLVFFLASVMLAATATSQTIEITPGQQTNVTSNISDLESQSSDLPLNFSTNNSTLYTSVAEGFPAQTGSITLNYTNNTETIDVEILEYSDWNLEVENFEDNLSVGETGRAGIINFTQKGNTQADITVEASGNLTEYLSYDDSFTLFPQNTIRKSFSYNIPSDTEFGNYNASLNFTEEDSNITEQVNLSTRFEDNIDPEITDSSFPDVMSTRSQNFSVSVSENYNTSTVSADIVREVEEERENKTVLVNESVETVDFDREGQEWFAEFDNTENIGQYYYTLNVEDAAGNKANKTGGFEVEGLDAVEFLRRNFRFDSVYPKDASGGVFDNKQSKASREILEVSEETSVDVELRNFQHGSDNSSITVGILKPDEDVSTKFDLDEENPSITLTEKGEYGLEVESDGVESFSGNLRVSLVDQHVGDKVRNIEFEGLVNNPEYPPEQSWSIRGWNGSLEYEDTNGDGEPDVLTRTFKADADVCKGYSTPEECPEINDFEEQTDRLVSENEDLKGSNGSLVWQRNIMALFSLVFLGAFIRSKNLTGRHVAVTPVKS